MNSTMTNHAPPVNQNVPVETHGGQSVVQVSRDRYDRTIAAGDDRLPRTVRHVCQAQPFEH